MSYEELDVMSGRIAGYLFDQGIRRGDRVAICLNRSPEMIACLIGILKAGARYVPLDSSYPPDRLEIMRDDARLSMLIIHKDFTDLFSTDDGRLVVWDEIAELINRQSPDFPPVALNGEDGAYVIFTSGSTGRPKGIEMPHRALANLIEWQLERPYFKKAARVLQYSSISFDVSFQEIATTLASGGTLILVGEEERRDPRILLDHIERFRVERLFAPFVALRSMVEVANATQRIPDSLQEVITAGEQLRVDNGLRQFFKKLPGAVLENQYGPSETHVISAYLLDKDPSRWSALPPIGKPIKNCDIHLLDENGKTVEHGAIGELYLAGKNVAHGYLGKPDLTEQAFIPNPFDKSIGATLYKTGDLGVINQDGDIEFMGRADHQIKIRGYRVEPGEVNNVGVRFDGIAQCLTRALRDDRGKQQLATYYVVQKGGEVHKEDFRAYLRAQLPEYMVPAYIMELDTIPYTPSGKVDLKLLPEPRLEIAAGKSVERADYQTETEFRLAQIWSEVLGIYGISRTDNFFSIGGDSLNAVTLFMKIEEQFERYLPLSSLSRNPTIEKLAQIVEGEDQETDFSRFRSLQLLKPGSKEQIPLFLVHGGAGNVLVFKELTEALPEDQPVFAFQWSGWDGYKGEDDIVEMARFYKHELQQVWPHGPYRLGGHCIGGNIVIELANMLKAEGEQVIDPLLISDSPNMYSRYFHSTEPEFTTESQARFQKIQQVMRSKIPERNGLKVHPKKQSGMKSGRSGKLFPVLAQWLPFYSQLGKLAAKVLMSRQHVRYWYYTRLAHYVPFQFRARYCVSSQIKAVKKHQCSIYDGDMLYLKSSILRGKDLALHGWWEDLYLGYRELCSGRFQGYVIGGPHDDVLKYPKTHEIIREKMFGESL